MASLLFGSVRHHLKETHRFAVVSPQGTALVHVGSRHNTATGPACSKLVTPKAIPASSKLVNSLSLRGCTPIYQRLPYCVGMFCRFFKIKEAKQIKQETRNFGKIAKARAKNLPAFAIFSEVLGFLLDSLCFLDFEKFTKHPHTVWQPLINGSAKVVIFGEIENPFVARAPSACVVFVWCSLARSEWRRRLLGLVWVASCVSRVAR